MGAIPKIILSGRRIICCEVFTLDVVLPSSQYLLVKGIVYSPQGEPLPNAAVEVLQIDKTIDPPIEKTIGVTFTIEDGSYGLSLSRSSGKDYRLVAYVSL